MRIELPSDPQDLTPELVIAMFGDPRRVAEIVFGGMDEHDLTEELLQSSA